MAVSRAFPNGRVKELSVDTIRLCMGLLYDALSCLRDPQLKPLMQLELLMRSCLQPGWEKDCSKADKCRRHILSLSCMIFSSYVTKHF